MDLHHANDAWIAHYITREKDRQGRSCRRRHDGINSDRDYFLISVLARPSGKNDSHKFKVKFKVRWKWAGGRFANVLEDSTALLATCPSVGAPPRRIL